MYGHSNADYRKKGRIRVADTLSSLAVFISKLLVVTGSQGALSGWIPRRDNGVVPGARIYNQRCCATTPSTYGGARHANKPGRYVTTSSTYDGTNLGIVRRCSVPMAVRTWLMCDIVQYLWWYKLGHCTTMSSTYGGTNNASRTLGMNRDKYAAYWLGELPQLGITSAGCEGSWTYHGLLAGKPPELGGYAPKGHAFWRRPWQGTCLVGAYLLAAVGGVAEETCPLGTAVTWWRLARAVTPWRLNTLVHRDSSRKTRQRKEKEVGQRFLLKRRASSRVSKGGPLALPTINRCLALVFWASCGQHILE
ncbi:hypothetical protein Cgig2_003769 [Carnegiea gigantea]|uniref:Uncharacterized protein n=1 Tax=Carnegiea gigantea TaxID=171969 RepID=A0A9Q1GJQ2_9CARY|nr:hypothetical protein Cgig2_003769 [Carnegiea gigantea]